MTHLIHRPSAILSLILCVFTSAEALAATPRKTLQRGEDLYFSGQYEDALLLLEELSRETGVSDPVRVEAVKYAAFCYFMMDARQQAANAWERLLAIDPSYELDPVDVSPEFIDFFGAIEPPPMDEPLEPERSNLEPKTLPPIVPATEVRGCGVLLCFVPFGVGQFANESYIKGSIFAALQAIFLGVNMTLYWTRVGSYDSGDFDQESADRSYNTQIVFFGLFATTAAVGIVDAFLFP